MRGAGRVEGAGRAEGDVLARSSDLGWIVVTVDCMHFIFAEWRMGWSVHS